MNAKRSPAGMVQALRRRSRVVVVLALGAVIAASVASLLIPRTFAARADVELGWTSGTPGPEFAARAADVQTRIVSHEAFASVAKDIGLGERFADLSETERSARTEEALASLREGTTVTSGPVSDAPVMLTLTVCDSDAETCSRVAGALARYAEGLHVDRTVNDRQAAVDALAAKVDEAEAAHAKAAKEHAAYRAENAEFLGGAGQKLQATREQKQQLREKTITALEQQKKQFDELLGQEKQFETVSVRQADPVRLAGIDDRVADTREQIRVLTVEEKKPDTDPEVVAQRARLTTLEEERKKLLAESPLVEQRRPNEQWLKLTKARADVQSQLDAAGRQLKLLLAAEKELEELARRTPEFEGRAKALEAAEAAAKQAAEERASELAAAESSLQAMVARGSMSIRVADAPHGPGAPAGLPAAVLALGGLAVGAIAGVAAALVRDRMDHSFRDADAVASFLGVPTLGAVDVIETPAESAARRTRARRSRTAVTSLGVVAGLVAALAVFGSLQGVIELVKSVVG